MGFPIWVGILGTIVGVAFFANSIRNLRKSQEGHAANAARIHIPMVVVFLPVMWIIVVSMSQ